GCAISDVGLYVTDERMEVQPVGVGGEIYVGGEGLARGYVGRPELTAERFLPDPFSEKAGSRLYRSGDLARFRADGDLEYLGRIDRQVKVRGFRIELAEIEAALVAHQSVREAAVILREDTPGDKRLVAYLTVKQQPAPNADAMRSFLRNKLPDYMVPPVFVILDEMPLTTNGKLDRLALPAPDTARPQLEQSYVAPRNELESLLVNLWQQVLRIERVGVEDDFFALGGDSIKGAIFINELQARLGEIIHVVAIFYAPTVAGLAEYLVEHYPGVAPKFFGGGPGEEVERNKVSLTPTDLQRVDSSKVAEMRRLIRPLSPRRGRAGPKNPSAVFVLSAPRSGSTLLRVMLAGHPLLFSPPELELLSFNTLEERRAAFTGGDSFWLEGTLRAIMQIKGCDADRARAIMQECEDRRLTTQQFYRLMQEWIGERRLVDKTPSYALDRQVLGRAEEDFDDALYIHLLRHPCGMIQSFDEYKLDQIFFRYEHQFSRRELAELIWVVSSQNIVEFLKRIPPRRKRQVRFEDLVSQPADVMGGLCDFLGLDLHPGMLRPYEDKREKMTDGIHAESRMLGDVKFHAHVGIDPRVGERWKDVVDEDSLGEPTRSLAESLGYGKRRGETQTEYQPTAPREGAGRIAESPLLLIQPGRARPPFFCVHPVGGGAIQYARLAQRMGPDQPFYGLQGLDPDEPYMGIEERAANCVKALREVEPRGPYLLGGWSFGGIVAFEMANQLRECGQEVALLALLDPMALALGKGRLEVDSFDSDDLATLVDQIVELVGWDSAPRLEVFRQMGRDDQLKSIAEQTILPPDVGPENAVNWLRGLRAKLIAARNYAPRVYPGRITLFRPSGEAGAASWEQPNTPATTSMWGELSSEPVEAYAVPGTHHTMILEPHVRVLAERLGACIRGAVSKNFPRRPYEPLCGDQTN
ncbi:MAG TPA: sulfotransferase, partial [Blastocatellia bacterium]|nr:sulfotransferase [Blastocatellia bacterium]